MIWNTTEFSPNATEHPSGCVVLKPQAFVAWNNSDNIVSYETQIMVKRVRTVLFIPLTFVLGVPANIINMVVFYRHGLKERINVCLFALSLADSLFLVFNMMSYAEQIYLQMISFTPLGPHLRWFMNHNLLGFFATTYVSRVLSAIIAAERCFCVLWPLRSQTILQTSTMTGIVVFVFVVWTALRFIVSTRYYVVCAYDPVRDTITHTVGIGEFYSKHRKMVDFVDIVMFGLAIPFVVIGTVILATIITVIKLRQAAEWRTGTSSSSGSVSARDIALTRMLVGNSIFFIACVFPISFFRIVLLFVPDMNAGRRYQNIFNMGWWLLSICNYINATFNIVIYYTMGSRYRQTFWAVLGRTRSKDTASKSRPLSTLSTNVQ